MDGEAYPGGSDKETCRPPDKKDLSRICAELNRVGARYVVVGGFAVIEAGYPRLTNDIPFASPKTLLRTKQTIRHKDVGDRLFLQGLTGETKKEEEPGFWDSLRAWFKR
jgi:hypothetical protein